MQNPNLWMFCHKVLFIIFHPWLTFHLRRTLFLLETGTLGISRGDTVIMQIEKLGIPSG